MVEGSGAAAGATVGAVAVKGTWPGVWTLSMAVSPAAAVVAVAWRQPKGLLKSKASGSPWLSLIVGNVVDLRFVVRRYV